MARHGLEWGAAWAFFDSDVVPTIGATPDLWQRYDNVLLLQEVKVPATASGPPKYGRVTGDYVAGGAIVKGSSVIREGEWYRLLRSPSPVELGKEFEGKQPSGAAPRPRPQKQ